MQKRVKAAKLHIYYEVGGQDLRITAMVCDGLSDSEENFFIWHNTMQAVRFETYVA